MRQGFIAAVTKSPIRREPTESELQEAKRLVELWKVEGRLRVEVLAEVLAQIHEPERRNALLSQLATKVSGLAATYPDGIPMKELLLLDPMRQHLDYLVGLARQGICHNCMQKIVMQGHKQDCMLRFSVPVQGGCPSCKQEITVQGHKEGCKSIRTWGRVISSEDGLNTTPEILDKPRPEYTAEGRSLGIEGDVVIDLVFLATWAIQVNRVVSGLGHGLDESAVRAAQQIRFQPAKRDGEPVDFPARVRIQFRLAY